MVEALEKDPGFSYSYNVASRFVAPNGEKWNQGQSVDMFLHHYPSMKRLAEWPRPAICFFVDDMWISSLHELMKTPARIVIEDLKPDEQQPWERPHLHERIDL